MIKEIFNFLANIIGNIILPKTNSSKLEQLEKMFKIIKENKLKDQKEIAEEKAFELQTKIKTNIEFANKLIIFKKEVGGKFGWSFYSKIFKHLSEDSDGKIYVSISKYEEAYARFVIRFAPGFLIFGLFIIYIFENTLKQYNLNIVIPVIHLIVCLFFFFHIYQIDSDYKAIELKNWINKKNKGKERYY